MIALCTAVRKTSHQLHAWGSVFVFAPFVYMSNAIAIRESYTSMSKSDLTCLLSFRSVVEAI